MSFGSGFVAIPGGPRFPVYPGSIGRIEFQDTLTSHGCNVNELLTGAAEVHQAGLSLTLSFPRIWIVFNWPGYDSYSLKQLVPLPQGMTHGALALALAGVVNDFFQKAGRELTSSNPYYAIYPGGKYCAQTVGIKALSSVGGDWFVIEMEYQPMYQKMV
ncbi:hypothetical protein C8Q78DRAFT_1082743 [Trametes maxima]|nr:hypothetical protein C8Q78DRAFT_1082743 [Trametes maxima]